MCFSLYVRSCSLRSLLIFLYDSIYQQLSLSADFSVWRFKCLKDVVWVSKYASNDFLHFRCGALDLFLHFVALRRLRRLRILPISHLPPVFEGMLLMFRCSKRLGCRFINVLILLQLVSSYNVFVCIFLPEGVFVLVQFLGSKIVWFFKKLRSHEWKLHDWNFVLWRDIVETFAFCCSFSVRISYAFS